MTSSPVIMNPDPESSTKKRKRKNLNPSPSLYNQKQLIQTNKWKSESKQRIYSTKLLQALHRVRNTSSSTSSSSVPRGSRAVREAADRALAFEAKGRTRWSRAVLTSRNKLKLKKVNKPGLVVDNENSKKKKKRVIKLAVKVNTKIPVLLQKKVGVLGRLVPGCRKVSFPDLLEEATDYIAAMEMQVKAMTSLAELLSGLGSTSTTTTTTTDNNNNNTDRVYQHHHPTITLAGPESFDVMQGVLGNPPL